MNELVLGRKSGVNARSYLLWLCLAQLVCWSVASIWLHHTAPLDVVEAIAWGNQWQWGYDRDPYLVAWLAKAVSVVAGNRVWPVFVLSQVCVVATFAAVWRFAGYLKLSEHHALLAVTFLLGCYYYHFTTPEFNDNVLQLPLWAWSQYYFYRAVKEQTLSTWVGFGVFVGLALMAKYAAIMLLLPLCLLLFLSKAGRRSFAHVGIYGGAIVGLLIVWPNIHWQMQHDWLYISYALERASVLPSLLNHFIYPIKFLMAQVLALLPAVLIYYVATKKYWRLQPVPGLLWWVTFGPVICVFFYSMISGAQMRSMWGTPLFSLVGLFIVMLTRPELSHKQVSRTVWLYLIFWTLSLIVFVASILAPPYWFGYTRLAQFPSQTVALQAEDYWRSVVSTPLKFVAGDRRLAARVSVYGQSHPTPYFDLKPSMSQWIDERVLKESGALFIWDVERQGKTLPAEFKRRFPQLTKPTVRQFHWHTGVNISPVEVGIAILPPS